MSVIPHCEQTCTQSCATPCGGIGAATERFQREAVRGVCDTGHYRCRFFSWGDGPPLLFLHGLADSSEAFIPAIALLSRFFRCIAYELPTGADDGADLRHYRHAHLVEDVWSLLDHLGVRQSYVFASSFGTTVALSALAAGPQRLLRAVLQAPPAPKTLTGTERLGAWLMSHWPGSMSSLPLRKRLLYRLHHAPFTGRAPAAWERFLSVTGAVPVRAVGRRARLLHRLDPRPLLAEVRQPVLLVCGDRESAAQRESAAALLRMLPGAGMVLLEGCGHLPSFSHPDTLAEVVRFFLTPSPPP